VSATSNRKKRDRAPTGDAANTGATMNYRMTASPDAIHACDFEDTVHWLQPRSAVEVSGDNAGARETFRQMTASLGLGALLTFGSAGAAIGPALAKTSEPVGVASSDQPIADLPRTQAAPLEMVGDVEIPTPDSADLALIVTVEVASQAALLPSSPAPTSSEPATPAVLVSAGAPAGEWNSFSSGPAVATAPAAAPVVPMAIQGPETNSQEASEVAAQPKPVEIAGERLGPDPQELMQFDNMRVPRWIVETILKASEVTGVDPVYMMALADKESSFIPTNKASTSSADGLFQFISSTWLEVVRSFGAKHGLGAEAAAITRVRGQLSIPDEAMREHVLGLRRDPYLSSLMAAEMMKRDRAKVESRLGRSITRSEFYLAHFFGVDSASRFMALLDGKPKQSAPRVFPKAARANKNLFFAKKGRKTRQLSVAEVYSKIDGMIDKRLDRYQGVMRAVAYASF
jgi:hypothetical protein